MVYLDQSNAQGRYALTARILQWVMATGFIFMWVCGYAMKSVVADDSQLEETLWGNNLEETTSELHEWLVYTMLVVAVIHIVAVIKHLWIDGHDLLYRMSFRN